MKILVTGGAGFLGKYVVKLLLDEGHEITILDNFSNSSNNDLKILEKRGVNIIKGDITKINDTDIATTDQNIVIHLAAKISVSESIKNPQETFQVNIEGTKNILKSCKKNKITKIIAASSAAVYGNCTSIEMELNEESNTNPISVYGESKLRMEKAIEEICLKNKIDYNILRIFNMYGIGQTSEYAGVITKFLEKIKQGEKIIIYGDGYQTRDFVDVNSVSSIIKDFIGSKENGIFNVASGKSTTIIQLAKMMIQNSNKKIEIKNEMPKKGDIKYSNANITKMKKAINYNLEEKFENIKQMMEYN